MDEVSLGAATLVGELFHGEIREYEIHPEDFGMVMASNRSLKVQTAQDSCAMLLGVLENRAGAARDIVILNAGVALYAANVAADVATGIGLARQAIESGAAKARMLALVELSQRLAK
jgi:anthranilate phosphoribosyltransferase